MEYERFFAELTPRLDAARSMERDPSKVGYSVP